MFANLMPAVLRGSKVVQSFVAKNSGPILVTLGVCTLSATFATTCRAAVKAHKEIEKTKKELEDPKTDKSEDNLKRIKRAAAIKVAKIMVVPVLFALMCAGCILGNHYIHVKRHATLAAAYALAEQNLKDYEDSIEPIVGQKKAEKIREEVARKDVERRCEVDQHNVYCTGKGDTLFQESKTGFLFRSSHDSIRYAFEKNNNKLNNFKCHNEELQLGDIWKDMNFPKNMLDSDVANAYGYCAGESVGVNLNVVTTTPWDEPVVVMSYHPHLLDSDMTL